MSGRDGPLSLSLWSSFLFPHVARCGRDDKTLFSLLLSPWVPPGTNCIHCGELGSDDATVFRWDDSVKSRGEGIRRRGSLLRLESAYFRRHPMWSSPLIPSFVSKHRGLYNAFSWDESNRFAYKRAQSTELVVAVRTRVFLLQSDGFFPSCPLFSPPSQQSM